MKKLMVVVILGILTIMAVSPAMAKETPFHISNLKSESAGVDGWYYATGMLKNNYKDVKYLQIEIQITDESGTVIGTTFANVTNLKKGQSWKFKALVTNGDVATVWTIVDLTAY
jgi:hypothetical protein